MPRGLFKLYSVLKSMVSEGRMLDGGWYHATSLGNEINVFPTVIQHN